MKRCLLMVALLAGFMVQAAAQKVLQPRWELGDPLIVSVDQISSNCVRYGDGDGYDALIDDDTKTHFHSSWAANEDNGSLFPDGEQYLEFDLGENAPQEIMIAFASRMNGSLSYCDCPNIFDLLVSADGEQWTTVKSYGPIWPYPNKVCNVTYEDKETFNVGQDYRFVRLLVHNTITGRTAETESHGKVAFFSLSEFQIYGPRVYNTDCRSLLQFYTDSLQAVAKDFTAGTTPGYYDDEKVTAYEDALGMAELAWNEGGYTDAEYEAFAVALRDAYEAVMAGEIPVTDGFYYILSGYEPFYTNQHVDKAIYATPDDDAAHWGTFEEDNPYHIWEIKDEGDGYFSLRNLKSGYYLGAAEKTSQPIPMTATFEQKQIIVSEGDGQFNIHNLLCKESYHCGGHSNGSGVKGSLMSWASSAWTSMSGTQSGWKIIPVTDKSIIDDALRERMQTLLNNALKAAADEGENIYNACFVYNVDPDSPLLTDVSEDNSAATSQIITNAKEEKEGTFAALIDGDYSSDSFFHTTWSAGTDDYNNLQVIFKEPVSQFVMEMWTRNWAYHDSPTQWRIFGTNDEALGTDAYSRSAQWTFITTLNLDFNDGLGVRVVSDAINLKEAYKYVRFVCMKTSTGRTNNYTGYPFFSIAEFQLYPFGIDEELSQYSFVEGMKEAADHLKELIDASAAKIENNTATQADIDAIIEATAAVKALTANTNEYEAIYARAVAMLENAYVGEDIAYFSVEDVDALETDLAAIDAAVDLDRPTVAMLAEAVGKLKALLEEFPKKALGPKMNTWYYLSGSPECGYEYFSDKFYYQGNPSSGSPIRFTNEYDPTEDPYAMWRFVPMTEQGEDVFAIQNLGTGMYIGPFPGEASKSLLMQTTPAPFQWAYFGQGQSGLVSLDSTNVYKDQPGYYFVHAAEASNSMVGWHSTMNSASSIVFTEVASEDAAISVPMEMNSIRVFTLPYNIPAGEFSLMELNMDHEVKTYGVKSASLNTEENTTTVVLTPQEEVKAGVPFIMVAGNLEQYDPEDVETFRFLFIFPDEVYPNCATEANGLVGTFDALTFSKPGLGIFDRKQSENGLVVTAYSPVVVDGQSGYLDFNKVKNLGEPAEGDLVITVEGLMTGVQAIESAAKQGGIKNIYTISGQQAGKNAKKLPKGIYIQNGKKFVVK